jgi:hypothetical protein
MSVRQRNYGNGSKLCLLSVLHPYRQDVLNLMTRKNTTMRGRRL